MLKNNLFRLFRNQSGQALLIIVLVLVVALTVGLSVASRSITNLRNSQDQASSQKALSAAESGVEQAIKSQSQTPLAGSFTGENTNYTTTISQISGATKFLIHGNNTQINEITKGNPVYIPTADYSVSNPVGWSGTLTIYWGEDSDACKGAALEISVISGTKANPILQRYAYDPCAARRAQNNGFTNSNPALITGTTEFNLQNRVSLPLASAFLVSVNPLYADTRIGASIGNTDPVLPSQGADIASTGTDNQVQRKVFVFQGLPQLPACLFSYTICSP
jgi:hypothetical protein